MIDYDRSALRAELSRDEGRRTKPYFDSKGIKTVGVGWNLQANGIPAEVQAILGLSLRDLQQAYNIDYEWPEAAIDKLLDIGIARAEAGLDGLLTRWRDMDAVRQRVCLNLCFNMGAKTLSEFKRTLTAIAHGDWEAAARGMSESLWAREVGPRATRLIAMMETGEAPA